MERRWSKDASCLLLLVCETSKVLFCVVVFEGMWWFSRVFGGF